MQRLRSVYNEGGPFIGGGSTDLDHERRAARAWARLPRFPTSGWSLFRLRGALAPHWGALLALALFLVAGLVVLDDYGFTTDENSDRLSAEATLSYLASGDLRAFTGALNANIDKFYGMAFSAPLLLAERAFGIDDDRRAIYLSRHLVTRLFFLVGGLFAYLLARRLFGSRALAVVAMLLFLLHPRLYAHSFFNPKDIPFLSTFMIALFLTHRAFKRDSVYAFVLLGVGVGLLVNLRIIGIVLLAAIPAMRTLDFALASGWDERKRALLMTGGFALASALTIYALLPYLWSDPIPRAVEGWAALSNHPIIFYELFRGTLRLNVDFPIEYLPVWFSITAPPFALLLGGVGTAAILAAVARAPRKALKSGRLRFGLLLIGCFALPVFTVMLPGGNIYNGWRQMYFLWAPFSLLAVFGLGALVSAIGRRRLRTAVYGATGAGLAATAVSMALIHPNQQVYFNALVDRVTPGLLGTQYAMDYWRHSMRQALERLADNPRLLQSGEARANAFPEQFVGWQAEMLPDAAQARLSGSLGAFYFGANPVAGLPSVKVYGSVIMAVGWRHDYRAIYEEALRRERILDDVFDIQMDGFDVHQMDSALALVKEPCTQPFLTHTSIVLRAVPVSTGDIPSRWRDRGFAQRIYPMGVFGASFDGKCVTSIPLPDYPIAAIDLSWRPELMSEAEARAKAKRARENGRLLTRAAHRSAYDVHMADGELVYLNEPCDPPETERPFHLNVFPENASDLPEAWRERGYERFHFEFHWTGAFVDGGCAAFFRLPDYPIVAIQTGQYREDGGDLWYAEFLIDPERRRAEAMAGASGEPVVRGAFDVHLAGGALVYDKEPCEQADTDARFFLHIRPESAEDLPNERISAGFDNLDFAFFPKGALFEGMCAARIPLPDYPVASVRTGQYVSGIGEIWTVEFEVGR